jgi:hypothetical protein
MNFSPAEHDPSVRFSAFTGAFADISPRKTWGDN